MPAAPPTVLIVDDDDAIREVTQLALEVFSGWRTIVAESGPVALELARENQPDVVLLDLMMPGMDGITTLGHLKASEETASIPVILLTAKSQIGPRQPWHDQPVHGVIPKPFAARVLASQISEMLGWPPPPELRRRSR